jgi:organic radical activating enzyme
MNIKEIFFSYQAEGLCIGSPTLFIRFAGCNLNCYYCDTKYAKKILRRDKVDTENVVKELLRSIKKYKPEFISLTGGEPLLQKGLSQFVKKIKEKCKIKIYLETNASLVKQFNDIVDLIDVCAVNLKIPDDDLNKKDVLIEAQKIVNLCKKKEKEFFIKIVVCGKKLYKNSTLKKICQFLIKTKPKVLILQPETVGFKKKNKKLFFNLTKIFEFAKKYVPSIHIIPQLHRTVYYIK